MRPFVLLVCSSPVRSLWLDPGHAPGEALARHRSNLPAETPHDGRHASAKALGLSD